MARKLAISALVALLLVGAFVAVWLLKSGPSSSRRPDTPGTTVVAPPPGGTVTPPDPGGTVEPQPIDVGPEPVTPSESDEPAVAGRVVAEESLTPIAGARVLIGPDVATSAFEAPGWIDAVDTDRSGRFRFVGLRPAPYRLRASAPGRIDASATGALVGGPETELRLAAGEEIPCRVVVDLEDREEPLPNQVVVFELPGEDWSLAARTDAGGIVHISGMSREQFDEVHGRIEVIVDGFADPFLRRSVEGEPTPYTILVDRGATAFGVVSDRASGRPIVGATVVSDYGHTTTTDSTGMYRIAGVEEGITVYAPGYAVETREIDEFTDDVEYVNPIQIDVRLHRGVILVGRVTNPSGEPVSGVRIGIAPDALDLDYDEERMEERLLENLSAISDAQGNYRIEGLSAVALDLPGFFEIEVRPTGSGKGVIEDVDAEVEEGEVRHDIVLDLVPQVTGTVTRSSGTALAGARVSAEAVDDENYQVTMTDAEGRFELRDLPAGEYRLAVELDGMPIWVDKLTAPASAPLDIRIGPGRSMRGLLVAEGAGTPLPGFSVRVVFIRGTLSITRDGETDAEGVFRFDDVPPGGYQLDIRRPPPHLPFLPEPPAHHVRVDVTDADWEGAIDYPRYPSGEVAFTFLTRSESGISPATEPVEVQVAYYQRDRFRVGSPTARRRGFPIGEATGSFQTRLRDGQYTFRCVLKPAAGKPQEQTVNATVQGGGFEELDVMFVVQ